LQNTHYCAVPKQVVPGTGHYKGHTHIQTPRLHGSFYIWFY